MAGRAPARGGPVGRVGGSSARGGSLAGRAGALQPKAAVGPPPDTPQTLTHTGSGTGLALFCASAGGVGGRRPGAEGRGRGEAAQQVTQHFLAHGEAPRHVEAACGERRDGGLGGPWAAECPEPLGPALSPTHL